MRFLTMKYVPAVCLSLLISSVVLAAEGEDPSVLAGTIIQSLTALIVFAILLAVLVKFAWGPILKGLQDRESKIRQDLEAAERGARQAAATLAEYEKQLTAARDESRRIIEQGRADAQKIAAQLRDQTEQEGQVLRQRAQQDIRTAKEQALAEIYAQTASLATQVAGRILQREIRPEDQHQLVQRSIEELVKRN
jgi:F-type H+-transporting ATPase subunit b